MSWLRSRWTVVALVPAFFLAGFVIVSALAGGSDDSDATAVEGSTTSSAGPATVTLDEGTAPTAPSGGAGSPTTPGDGTAPRNGDGGAPGGLAPGAIEVDYGQWEGIFELGNPSIVPDFGIASVVGELRYLGGVDCPVGLVRVRAWFYDDGGSLVGETVWESVQSTGDGGEVTGREPLPFEAVGQISELPVSAALRFTAVECL
jgi:hypothetical protein